MSKVPVPSGAVAPPFAPGAKPGLSTMRAVNDYLDDRLRTGGVTRYTAGHMRGPLYAFAEHVPEDASRITRRDVLRWLDSLEHLSPATRGLYFTRVRGFTTWLLRRGVVGQDPFLEVPPPKVPRSVHRCLSGTQARALLAACATPRATVIVMLGLHTGLRRAELAALDVGDVDLAARTILVRAGKGGHQRLLPLSTEAARVVRTYLQAEGLSRGPLLRNEAQPSLGIRPGTVSRVFSDVAYRSGVKAGPGDRVGPHSLRHTFATDVYEQTNDVMAVRDLLGHVSLENTQRYVRGMNVERLRGAVERSYLSQPGVEAAQ